MSNPRSEKAESDTEADSKVAGSRASDDEGEQDSASGPYVGRSSSDDDFDAEESGAEARSDDT
jgi:hypothetical protein